MTLVLIPEGGMDDNLILAEIRNSDDFVNFMRIRFIEQLKVSYETVDQVSGVQSGYTAKLLSPEGIRNFGRMSFDCLMGCGAVKLYAVEDKEQLARIRVQLETRKYKPHTSVILAKKKKKKDSRWGRTMRARQLLLQSPRHRKAIGKHAITVRWDRVKAAAKGGS